MKFLVENGADIEIGINFFSRFFICKINNSKQLANRHGHTALMIAAYREQAEVVNYLLSIGALTDRRSVKGKSVHYSNRS